MKSEKCKVCQFLVKKRMAINRKLKADKLVTFASPSLRRSLIVTF